MPWKFCKKTGHCLKNSLTILWSCSRFEREPLSHWLGLMTSFSSIQDSSQMETFLNVQTVLSCTQPPRRVASNPNSLNDMNSNILSSFPLSCSWSQMLHPSMRDSFLTFWLYYTSVHFSFPKFQTKLAVTTWYETMGSAMVLKNSIKECISKV